MISKDELLDLARFHRLKPHQQEKHYLQSILLNSLYSVTTNELVFKGGTALFFLFGLPRFSEDLDFTIVSSLKKEKLIENVSRDLIALGILHRIHHVKENNTSLSFTVGAEGPLFTKEIERNHVRIEISKRETVMSSFAHEISSYYPDIPSFSILAMDNKEILAEKVRALFSRSYARDLFDIYFLLKKGVIVNKGLIAEKLKYYAKTFNLDEFKRSINFLEKQWAAELNPFVIGELVKFKDVKKFVLEFF